MPLRLACAQECSKGCVYTYGYDESRDNVNPNESILKASSLSLTATNSPDLSGIVYAQPLYVSQVSVKVNGQAKTVNALFVATEENYVYALDADTISNAVLWSKNLNNTGETAVPDSALPRSCGNIAPEVGITGTPVIDTSANVLYVVSKHYNGSTTSQRLNVLNLYDGSPAATAIDIGTALGSSFSALNQNQRAGLALVSQGIVPNGGPFVYVAWGAHCDGGTYNGWVADFQFTPGTPGTLTFKSSFNDQQGTGASDGGIWMSGAAPAVTAPPSSTTDADVYLATGNGSFSFTNNQFGESVLKLDDSSGAIAVAGSYTPKDWSVLNKGSFDSMGTCTSPLNLPPPYTSGSTVCVRNDMDLGAGGVMLVRPAGSGYLPAGDSFVVLAAGKEGVFYVLDPSNMSNTGADTSDCSTGSSSQALQCFGAITIPTGNLPNDAYGNRGSAAFWAGNTTFKENVLYVAGSQDSEIRAYQMTANGGGVFTTGPTIFGTASAPNANGSGVAPYPGSSPVVSWNTNDSVNGAKNAILWILDTSGYNSGPAKIYAYSAVPAQQGGQLSQAWHDSTKGPLPTKFMVPTVVNGYVYVGGQKPGASCSAGSCLGRVVAWH